MRMRTCAESGVHVGGVSDEGGGGEGARWRERKGANGRNRETKEERREKCVCERVCHLSPKKRWLARESVSTPVMTAAGSDPRSKADTSPTPMSILGTGSTVRDTSFA